MNNPDMSRALHKAVRENSPLSYEDYRRQIFDGRPITAIRDLLEFASDRQPIPLDDVEDAPAICSRFCTGGMSLGALSREAHEVIALGMNRVGGKSNCGEGGEDKLRFKQIQDVDENGHSPSFPHLKGLRNGDTAMSATKQLASGRFGVTAEYLVNAEQLEIKVAQGAKPGEGGQLPGPKVDAYIAGLRNSVAGVELISPPPHHDIYSIEDLAQLIYDLHQISPKAKVSVKLVANAGIGTVAAGVAKAGADIIQISGHDGGTGASPLSSIMHAGGPWEQGLAEVQGTLSQNGLRDQVTLRIDGGFKTGWDIVTSAMMGGEEYGFGSIVMIAEGCIMARVCHENRCPVGIATQKEQLRKKFPGTPEHVANYMLFVAEEVRVILAALGYRSLSEIIGRGDLLRPRSDKSIRTSVPQPPSATSVRHVGGTTLQDCKQERKKLSKTAFVDLSPFYLRETPDEEKRVSWVDVARNGDAHSNGPVLADKILEDEGILRVIDDNNGTWEGKHAITSYDRSVGARMAGVIARKHGDYGFQGKIKLTLEGVAGQSFGAFLVKGMQLTVVGEVNDFVAKGMSGGIIVVHPPPSSTFDTRDNVICGNTCLYGASGGEVYLNGRVGDRFGVRNGGCSSVIEGCGTHLGEYMTGGVIVALGDNTGNVGAGMSGGLLYLYDPEDRGITYSMNVDNRENIFRVDTPEREAQLKSLIQNHQEYTGSSCAAEILKDWSSALKRFWLVAPPSEQKKAAASKPAAAEEDADALRQQLMAAER
jgi:glutamate synthase (ferredoxin)